MSDRFNQLLRTVGLVVGLVVTAAVGWILFVRIPGDLADLLGVVLVLLTVIGGFRLMNRLLETLLPRYNVAEVAVEGPITRNGSGGPLPARPGGTAADAIVEQIERADEDRHAKGLVVRLNTPGGEVVPSDDIRRAVEAFDGPTVAYTTDRCASGGYWIASGCDQLVARDASLVGSIGVLGSRVTAHELLDRVGLSYEQLTAGEYKDAGVPLKELSDQDRQYLQGLIDGFYETFIDRVTDGRELEEAAVRDTEARVYLGEEAAEIGLVDALGDQDDATAYLADELGIESATVEEFEPSRPLRDRLQSGVAGVAYAFGAGIAGVVDDGQQFRFELR
ncbi:MAG: signal peptide peptidase SppA [Halobacteriales archaeon]|nr:signal peptide peptidase SppA [Halobacteriales archaeon]